VPRSNRRDLHQLLDLGFDTGNPRVGFFRTVPEPAYTVPATGTGTNRTANHTVLYETRGITDTRGYFAKPMTNSILKPQNTYSTTSTSETSLFLFELAFTAARTSSKKTRSWRPQEPRQRKARMDEAWSRLRVNDRSWRPCEKTRSTAVDVATKSTVSYTRDNK
jgi:hypothetical protein